jgi:hypothetical protein
MKKLPGTFDSDYHDLDGETAAVRVLKNPMFAEETIECIKLREKLCNHFFPTPFNPTFQMMRGIRAEQEMLPSKPVLQKMKEAYSTNTKFHPNSELLPDEQLLETKLGIIFDRKDQMMVASLDGKFNKDCVVEFKHGDTYDLENLIEVHKGA